MRAPAKPWNRPGSATSRPSRRCTPAGSVATVDDARAPSAGGHACPSDARARRPRRRPPGVSSTVWVEPSSPTISSTGAPGHTKTSGSAMSSAFS